LKNLRGKNIEIEIENTSCIYSKSALFPWND
jgi:hypothetical protein